MEGLKDIPEFYEVDLGESLISRTETLGELPLIALDGRRAWASLAVDVSYSTPASSVGLQALLYLYSRCTLALAFGADVASKHHNTTADPLRFPTASFRELGPPDLCHIIKTTGKAGNKDVCSESAASLGAQLAHSSSRRAQLGSYHYVSGVDGECRALLYEDATDLSLAQLHHPLRSPPTSTRSLTQSRRRRRGSSLPNPPAHGRFGAELSARSMRSVEWMFASRSRSLVEWKPT